MRKVQDEYSIFYIYVIHNIINNKIYVGKTIDPVSRWYEHITSKNTQYIHRAIRKYGVDSFIFTVIHKLNSEIETNNAERYWIRFYKSNVYRYGNEFGYNMTDGGEGSFGYRHSNKTKQKISIVVRAFYENNLNPRAGKTLSEETKQLISQGNTGKRRTQEVKDNFSKMRQGSGNGFYGKTHSPETKAKISERSQKLIGELNPFFGHTLSEETKEKIRQAHLGKPTSDETKNKISENMMGERNHFFGKHHTEETKELLRGENCAFAKLTDQKVIEIKKLLMDGELSRREIALKYAVTRSNIDYIANGKTWAHIVIEDKK
jgi:predicted GIY-YIG superfamily endonuclease